MQLLRLDVKYSQKILQEMSGNFASSSTNIPYAALMNGFEI